MCIKILQERSPYDDVSMTDVKLSPHFVLMEKLQEDSVRSTNQIMQFIMLLHWERIVSMNLKIKADA
jgi:hypothetical protein